MWSVLPLILGSLRSFLVGVSDSQTHEKDLIPSSVCYVRRNWDGGGRDVRGTQEWGCDDPQRLVDGSGPFGTTRVSPASPGLRHRRV